MAGKKGGKNTLDVVSELTSMISKAPAPDKILYALSIVLLLVFLTTRTLLSFLCFAGCLAVLVVLIMLREALKSNHEYRMALIKHSENDEERTSLLHAARRRIEQERAMQVAHDNLLAQDAHQDHLRVKAEPDNPARVLGHESDASGKKREES